jgi:type III restriction enzyme
MGRKGANGAAAVAEKLPVQPVEKPILCNAFEEPGAHWVYDSETGAAQKANGRRPASYWYKSEKTGSQQASLGFLAEEERDELPLVNLLREDVRRLRKNNYAAWPKITRELLQYWARTDRGRRLFFCQREAVETILYLFEFRIWKTKRLPFQPALSDEDLGRLLAGVHPSFSPATQDFFPRLVDPSPEDGTVPLRRMAAKMATGSGKTVVMSMLIAWAFCNRGELGHLKYDRTSIGWVI